MKRTKNELKIQRDALKRFTRFLPTLQLKKQQLQAEIRTVMLRKNRVEAEMDAENAALAEWIGLFAEPFNAEEFLKITAFELGEGNIAGMAIPVLKKLVIEMIPPAHTTPLWYDDAVLFFEKMLRLRAEAAVIEEQWNRLSHELRVTSQRVNLFEKVKIPEAKNNIRIIRIYLGDQQTAAVARAKRIRQKMNARAA